MLVPRPMPDDIIFSDKVPMNITFTSKLYCDIKENPYAKADHSPICNKRNIKKYRLAGMSQVPSVKA